LQINLDYVKLLQKCYKQYNVLALKTGGGAQSEEIKALALLSKQLAEFRDIVHSLKQDVLTLKQQGQGSPTTLPVMLKSSPLEASDDLLPKKPDVLLENQTDNLLPTIPALKSSPESDAPDTSNANQSQALFESADLDSVKGIPVAYMSKAAELLNILKVEKEISWDTQGNLFLHNKLVPDVNFYELFSKLFSSKTPSQPDFYKLANFISTLGHGHLLHSQHTMGLILPKKRKLSEERNEIQKRLLEHQNWYYLGP
jgi:hypothetical protein